MKTTLIILVGLLSYSSINAQIIDFPDPAFKDKLINHNPVIDTNNDGEIQETEAASFSQTIDISGTPTNPGEIEDLTGLNFFTNISGFQGSYNEIMTADFSDNLLLESITMNENPLNQINVSENTALKFLNISQHNLTFLDVSNLSNLLLLQINFGFLKGINLSGCTNLEYVYLQANDLVMLNIQGLDSLLGINLSSNPLATIDPSDLSNLLFFNARNTQLLDLDLSSNANLLQVDVKGSASLSYINVRNGNNDQLDISGGVNTCNFEDLPALEFVCIDEIGSPLSTYIQNQTVQEITFLEECVLSQNDLTKLEVSLYPNPTKSRVFIESNTPITDIYVYDILGNLVHSVSQWGSQSTLLALENLTPGLYLVTLQDASKRSTNIKLIKQ